MWDEYKSFCSFCLFVFTFHMSRADLASWVCDEFILYQKLGGLDGPKRKHKLHKIECFLS